MRGILSAGGYVPAGRLERSAIRDLFGSGGGKGTRSVASFDEDTTTMAVEAARAALAPVGVRPQALWFATSEPAYVDKTNAAAIHAALRLGDDAGAYDMGGAIRSGIGTLRAALDGTGSVLVAAADIRAGLPTSADEAQTGDGAAAVLVGDEGDGEVIATYLGGASATREVIERWRTPGSTRSRVWEERFGESVLVPAGLQAWERVLEEAKLEPADVDRVIVTGMHARACNRLRGKLGLDGDVFADTLSDTVGNTATAHPALVVSNELERASADRTIVVVSLADGADALAFRTTPAIEAWAPRRSLADQLAASRDVPYARFLSWRGMVRPEPPNRPEPARVSAPAAERAEDRKFGFEPVGDAQGTIATFTVDRLAFSPSPPIVFAMVDFDEGGRQPVELTDVDPETLQIGDRVEPTFRRLQTADGIHNYYWKCRPLRSPQNGAEGDR